ncbi:MAG TPA: hypothetical protein VGC97_00550 [Pyrinomonadaceae bacterium]|jgi:hypothetical protein
MKNLSVVDKTQNQAPPKYETKFSDENNLLTRRSHKIKILVDALRLVSQDKDISKETLIIPDECEIYGFSEGKHNLGILLHFLADMLEE